VGGAGGVAAPPQVQSRVQKYFLKLQRAGLPVPGRLPPQRNRNRYFRCRAESRAGASLSRAGAKRRGQAFSGRTTFLTSVVPEVAMEEEGWRGEEAAGGSSSSGGEEEEWPQSVRPRQGFVSEHWSGQVRDSAEYRELRWLQRVRAEKEAELAAGGSAEHPGHSCARCGARPLLGTRCSPPHGAGPAVCSAVHCTSPSSSSCTRPCSPGGSAGPAPRSRCATTVCPGGAPHSSQQ
jgi:hypothetical protein